MCARRRVTAGPAWLTIVRAGSAWRGDQASPRGWRMTGSQADLLVQVLPDGAELRFRPRQQVMIGRDTDAQVLVAHPRASRRHAMLAMQQAGWVLTDQSSNGTFIDGRPIHQMTIYSAVTVRVGDPDHGQEIRLATAPAGAAPPAPAPAPGGYQAT